MAVNWYETQPGDSDVVSQHPANERTFRSAVKGAFEVEHTSANGRHVIGAGNDAARNALNGTWVEGNMWVSGQDGRTRIQRAASVVAGVPGLWQNLSSEFEAGCIMVFANGTAPTGWTQINWDDHVIRLTNGAAGGSGGSWAISGLSNESADHAHTVIGSTSNETANHTHTFSGTTNANGSASAGFEYGGDTNAALTGHAHTFSGTTAGMSGSHAHTISFWTSGVGNGHTHSGNGAWRPAYVNFMACQKS